MDRLFLALLVLSYSVAAAALMAIIRGHIMPNFLLAATWLLMTVIAFIAFKRKAMWFLLGAPFALGPTLWVALYLYECIPTKSCL